MLCSKDKAVCVTADLDENRSAFVIVYAFIALVSGGIGFVLGLLLRG
jgi:hypothetical protein